MMTATIVSDTTTAQADAAAMQTPFLTALVRLIRAQDGYGAWDGQQPYVGQEMAFVWVSLDETRRSNAAFCTWE